MISTCVDCNEEGIQHKPANGGRLENNNGVADRTQEEELLKKMTTMLVGIPPPPSLAICKMTCAQMLESWDLNKDICLLPENSPAYLVEVNPKVYYFNSCLASENIADLSIKLQARYVQSETASSYTFCTEKEKKETNSARKRRLYNGLSPGRRLSHLARRRQIFSKANLKQLAQNEPKNRLAIKASLVPPRNIAKEFLSLKEDSDKSRNLPKRALFQSPEDPPIRAGYRTVNRQLPRRRLFDKPEVPLRESAQLLPPGGGGSYDVSSWLASQPFAGGIKRLREEVNDSDRKRRCPRRSLDFSDGSPSQSSQNSSLSANTNPAPSPHIVHLTAINKKKLLWAIATVLKENQITHKDDIFKSCATALYDLCRRNISCILGLVSNNGTSDKMLTYARQQVGSVIDICKRNYKGTIKQTSHSTALTDVAPSLLNQQHQMQPSQFQGKENTLKTPRPLIKPRIWKSCLKASRVSDPSLVRSRSFDDVSKGVVVAAKFIAKGQWTDITIATKRKRDESLEDASISYTPLKTAVPVNKGIALVSGKVIEETPEKIDSRSNGGSPDTFEPTSTREPYDVFNQSDMLSPRKCEDMSGFVPCSQEEEQVPSFPALMRPKPAEQSPDLFDPIEDLPAPNQVPVLSDPGAGADEVDGKCQAISDSDHFSSNLADLLCTGQTFKSGNILDSIPCEVMGDMLAFTITSDIDDDEENLNLGCKELLNEENQWNCLYKPLALQSHTDSEENVAKAVCSGHLGDQIVCSKQQLGNFCCGTLCPSALPLMQATPQEIVDDVNKSVCEDLGVGANKELITTSDASLLCVSKTNLGANLSHTLDGNDESAPKSAMMADSIEINDDEYKIGGLETEECCDSFMGDETARNVSAIDKLVCSDADCTSSDESSDKCEDDMCTSTPLAAITKKLIKRSAWKIEKGPGLKIRVRLSKEWDIAERPTPDTSTNESSSDKGLSTPNDVPAAADTAKPTLQELSASGITETSRTGNNEAKQSVVSALIENPSVRRLSHAESSATSMESYTLNELKDCLAIEKTLGQDHSELSFYESSTEEDSSTETDDSEWNCNKNKPYRTCAVDVEVSNNTITEISPEVSIQCYKKSIHSNPKLNDSKQGPLEGMPLPMSKKNKPTGFNCHDHSSEDELSLKKLKTPSGEQVRSEKISETLEKLDSKSVSHIERNIEESLDDDVPLAVLFSDSSNDLEKTSIKFNSKKLEVTRETKNYTGVKNKIDLVESDDDVPLSRWSNKKTEIAWKMKKILRPANEQTMFESGKKKLVLSETVAKQEEGLNCDLRGLFTGCDDPHVDNSAQTQSTSPRGHSNSDPLDALPADNQQEPSPKATQITLDGSENELLNEHSHEQLANGKTSRDDGVAVDNRSVLNRSEQTHSLAGNYWTEQFPGSSKFNEIKENPCCEESVQKAESSELLPGKPLDNLFCNELITHNPPVAVNTIGREIKQIGIDSSEEKVQRRLSLDDYKARKKLVMEDAMDCNKQKKIYMIRLKNKDRVKRHNSGEYRRNSTETNEEICKWLQNEPVLSQQVVVTEKTAKVVNAFNTISCLAEQQMQLTVSTIADEQTRESKLKKLSQVTSISKELLRHFSQLYDGLSS